MTEAQPWVKWRYDRWRADEGLRMCGLAARGLWADLLAIMHGCKPYGHLAVNGRPPTAMQIASMVGMTTEIEVTTLLAELESNGVFSRSDDGLIFSRRQVRDQKAKETGKTNGLLGGNPTLIKRVEKRVNPNSKRVVKTEKREERRESEKERIPSNSHEAANPRATTAPARSAPLEGGFEIFWKLYPRKQEGPAACRKEWDRALKAASAEEIISGLRRYPFKPDFLPMAATWLNQKRWLTQAKTPPPLVLTEDHDPTFSPGKL